MKLINMQGNCGVWESELNSGFNGCKYAVFLPFTSPITGDKPLLFISSFGEALKRARELDGAFASSCYRYMRCLCDIERIKNIVVASYGAERELENA